MWNLTLNTFKEIVRNKFLYLIVVFWLLFILFSISLWKLTLWNDDKIIVDFWLAMIEIFWLIWVLFVWSQLLFKEIEWKTIFLILSKPIKRYEFILWKFFWFGLVLSLILFFQSALFLVVLFVKWIWIDYLILFSILFIYFKLIILIAIVLFLSTFMSNILTIIVSILIYFVSHSFSLLLDLVYRLKIELLTYFTKILQLLFPPFEALNLKDFIWSNVSFSINFFVNNTIYSIVYLVIILTLTSIIFSKKRFEN